LCKPRGAVGGGLEAQIALAASAAFGHHDFLIGLCQVKEGFSALGIDNHCARRHLDDQVRTTMTGPLTALTVFTVGGLIMLFETKMVEGSPTGCYVEDNVAALAAVTAVRAAAGNEALASEADATTSPVAGLNGDSDFIDELHAA